MTDFAKIAKLINCFIRTERGADVKKLRQMNDLFEFPSETGEFSGKIS